MTPGPDPRRGLALVGSRGSGKSTVGRLLAGRLGRPFVDADVELEARAGRSIGAIFAESGEAAFRDLEEDLLRDLVERGDGSVLATGGGVVIRPANREALKRLGFVAWLAADPAVLADRLRTDPALATRPALTAAGTLGEIAEVLAARTPLYREVADVVIATEGRSAEQVAAAVLDAWREAEGVC